MIRTLDANYLSTCPDQRRGLPPSTCHQAPYYAFCWGLVADYLWINAFAVYEVFQEDLEYRAESRQRPLESRVVGKKIIRDGGAQEQAHQWP